MVAQYKMECANDLNFYPSDRISFIGYFQFNYLVGKKSFCIFVYKSLGLEYQIG